MRSWRHAYRFLSVTDMPARQGAHRGGRSKRIVMSQYSVGDDIAVDNPQPTITHTSGHDRHPYLVTHFVATLTLAAVAAVAIWLYLKPFAPPVTPAPGAG